MLVFTTIGENMKPWMAEVKNRCKHAVDMIPMNFLYGNFINFKEL